MSDAGPSKQVSLSRAVLRRNNFLALCARGDFRRLRSLGADSGWASADSFRLGVVAITGGLRPFGPLGRTPGVPGSSERGPRPTIGTENNPASDFPGP